MLLFGGAAAPLHGAMDSGLTSASVGVKSSWTWAWGLYEEDSGHTRLVARLHADPKEITTRLMVDLFEIVMMRKCLLGIKRRAEGKVECDASAGK